MDANERELDRFSIAEFLRWCRRFAVITTERDDYIRYGPEASAGSRF